MKKTTQLPLLLSTALLFSCGNSVETEVKGNDVKIATYNLSFDRLSFETLVEQMEISPTNQDELVTAYLAGTITDEDEEETAEKIIQIRNVAAIIQKNRPNVIMMSEFNNDGTGDDLSALNGFQENYLSVAQSLDGAGGEANLEPITFSYLDSYSTNTGLVSDLDLNNNGTGGDDYDTWGFGLYHGQYAFALMSQYEIDTDNTRTFQTFKWKDLEGQSIPTITVCDGSYTIPDGMSCGDNWYTDSEWEQVRLSSKNHVDAPIIIPTENGNEVIHLLMSHPTPPVYDTGKNLAQNAAEVNFWNQYINNKDFFYDDNGITGGLAENEKFIIMGDQNLDPVDGDGEMAVMQALHDDPSINQGVTNGEFYPTSEGATEYATDESIDHPSPTRITSTFGLNVDYVLPSANIDVIDSGVYWPTSDDEGRLLLNDERIGNGTGKDISSDHRITWIKINLD